MNTAVFIKATPHEPVTTQHEPALCQITHPSPSSTHLKTHPANQPNHPPSIHRRPPLHALSPSLSRPLKRPPACICIAAFHPAASGLSHLNQCLLSTRHTPGNDPRAWPTHLSTNRVQAALHAYSQAATSRINCTWNRTLSPPQARPPPPLRLAGSVASKHRPPAQPSSIPASSSSRSIKSYGSFTARSCLSRISRKYWTPPIRTTGDTPGLEGFI